MLKSIFRNIRSKEFGDGLQALKLIVDKRAGHWLTGHSGRRDHNVPFWRIWLCDADRWSGWPVDRWPVDRSIWLQPPICTWAYPSIPVCTNLYLCDCIAVLFYSPLISVLPTLQLSTTWAFYYFNKSFCLSMFLRERYDSPSE